MRCKQMSSTELNSDRATTIASSTALYSRSMKCTDRNESELKSLSALKRLSRRGWEEEAH